LIFGNNLLGGGISAFTVMLAGIQAGIISFDSIKCVVLAGLSIAAVGEVSIISETGSAVSGGIFTYLVVANATNVVEMLYLIRVNSELLSVILALIYYKVVLSFIIFLL